VALVRCMGQRNSETNETLSELQQEEVAISHWFDQELPETQIILELSFRLTCQGAPTFTTFHIPNKQNQFKFQQEPSNCLQPCNVRKVPRLMYRKFSLRSCPRLSPMTWGREPYWKHRRSRGPSLDAETCPAGE